MIECPVVMSASNYKSTFASEIIIESSWCMNTPQANQSMKRKAESLIANLKKVKAKEGLYSDFIKVFEKYFKAYEKACLSPSCYEASREEVRELVFEFSVKAGKAVGVTRATLNTLFNKQINLKSSK